MAEILRHTFPRFSGRILVIGEHTPELLRTAQPLEEVAATTIVNDDEARATLARFDVDVVVIDADTARPSLAELTALRPTATRILLAGATLPPDAREDPDLAILPSPVDPHALHALCRLALRAAVASRSARDVAYRQRRLQGLEPTGVGASDDDQLSGYAGVLSRSPLMNRVFATLRAIEGSDTTVLVQGEAGSGKELVAQAIHARSRRRHARFVAVDLGAIPAEEREAALFGRRPEAGNGDGAGGRSTGLVAEAQGGCLFIDQIDLAGPALQLALLGLVEEGLVSPVGADRPQRIDLRVIAATSQELSALVREGRFRADLHHQLHLCTVDLPPLRARGEDVFPLAKHFLVRASLALGRTPPDISREARALLEEQPWDGNVRELRNAMERAAILCRSGLVIAADLPIAGTLGVGPSGSTIAIPPGGATLVHLEREIFIKTLAMAGGNQSRAAQILGLCESTFRFRLQKLGIASRRSGPSRVAIAHEPLTARA